MSDEQVNWTERRIEGTYGGSESGPTADVDGTALADGDRVTLVHQEAAEYQWLVGKDAIAEWVQDVFPFSQVFLNFQGVPGNENVPALSTFSLWVRKVAVS